jgi:hypothetical protein
MSVSKLSRLLLSQEGYFCEAEFNEIVPEQVIHGEFDGIRNIQDILRSYDSAKYFLVEHYGVFLLVGLGRLFVLVFFFFKNKYVVLLLSCCFFFLVSHQSCSFQSD